jgi:hypothetical protein
MPTRNTRHTFAATLAAALLLAAATSTATARVLSYSNQNIRVTWGSLEFVSDAATVRCPLSGNSCRPLHRRLRHISDQPYRPRRCRSRKGDHRPLAGCREKHSAAALGLGFLPGNRQL